MASFGEIGKYIPLVNSFYDGKNNTVDLILTVMIVICAIIIIGGFFYYIHQRRKWNIKVEFKLPRAVQYLKKGETLDYNNIKGNILTEFGKGMFDTRRGAVFLKRKGKKKISMKPFNINKYLQDRYLTVVQVGAEEYVPIVPESFLMFIDDETGDTVSVIQHLTDFSESKAWKSNFERTAKNAYSISDALMQLLTNPFFMIGLVIFLWGLQLLLLYNKISK